MKISVKLGSSSSISLFIWLILFSAPAFAAIDNAGILDNVLTRYSAASSAWAAVITSRASWLFWTLALISMVWTFGMMALRRGDLGEFFAEFVRFTIFTGFFWWLLVNGPAFSMSIINSLRQIGAQATGLSSMLAPSGIVDIGFDIFFKVLDQSSVWAPVDSACGIIIGAIILVVFALVGVNMLLLLISSWILAYAGIFFLGFGGSRWTSEMAIGYFRTVLNIAAQLFTMVLLIGIGKSFVDQYYSSMSAGISLKELGVMLVVSAVMLAMVKTIPGLIGGLAGGNAGSLGSGFGAGAALGAAALGAAAIGTAGAAVVAGTASMAGGAQALMTAVSKASAGVDAGGGYSDIGAVGTVAAGAPASARNDATFAAAMGDGESGSVSLGNSSIDAGASTVPARTQEIGGEAGAGSSATTSEGEAKTNNGSNSSNVANPPNAKKAASAIASKVGKIAAGTGINLAHGSWDVLKSASSGLKDAMMDRVSETTGGKIAAAIAARHAASTKVNQAPIFDADGLAPGPANNDAEAEIAAFRDRDASSS